MESKESVFTSIRSLLNSSKEQMTITALNRDYSDIIGSPIPFKKYGCQTLEDFLRTIPNVRINRIGRDIYVDVKPDEKTAHITKLVQGQNRAKKKSKKRFNGRPRSAPLRSSNYSNNYSSNYRSQNGYGNRNRYNNQSSYSSNAYSSNHSNYSSRPNTYRDLDASRENAPDPQWKYRSSVPTQYDFSDHEEDYANDPESFDSPESDCEFVEPGEPCESVKVQEERKYEKLTVTLNNTNLGAGRGIFKIRGAGNILSRYNLRSRQQNQDSYVHHSASVSKKAEEEKMSAPRNTLRKMTCPGSLLAAGRSARQETDQKSGVENRYSSSHLLHPDAMRNPLVDIPFGQLNVNIPCETNYMPPESRFLHNSLGPGFLRSPTGSNQMFGNLMSPRSPSKQAKVGNWVSGPVKDPPYLENTACQKLFAMCIKHKLGIPVFANYHSTNPKTKQVMYMSKVTAGDSSSSSIPLVHPDLNEVQEQAAKNVLEELNKRYENVDCDVVGTATEKCQIISRITEIVSNHSTGLKSEMVEIKFKEMFKERLPSNWLDIIKTASLLSVEKIVSGTVVYPILDLTGEVQNVSQLPPLILPETDYWDVLITSCLSTNQVFFRIVGDQYDGKYATLAQTMQTKYNEKGDNLKPAEIIREGNYYAACLQGDWYRVKVLSTNLGDKYRVSLIDHGDTDEVLRECIFPLEGELTDLPAQSIRCSLTYLEKYHDNEYVTHMLNSMVHTRIAIIAQINSKNPHLMVTLYDTTTTDDININKELLERMDKELSPPAVPLESKCTDVYLTRVEEDGKMWVQIVSESLKLLMSLMADVKFEMLKHEQKYRLKSLNNLIGEQLVLAKYEVDGMWYRAVVKSLLNGQKDAQVHFVDYGNTEIVPVTDLAELTHFSNVLAAIPHQVVAVQFVKPTTELFTQSVIEFLMSMAQSTDDEEAASRLFLMKVIKSAPVPDVELFLRDDHNFLTRLDDILGSYFTEYRSPTFKDVRQNLGKEVANDIQLTRLRIAIELMN